MNILLHICCAPCAIYPYESLKENGHTAVGFFYNPNIHPYSEYLRRKEYVERYSKEAGMDVIYANYEVGKYFHNVSYDETPDKRCPTCWRMRSEETLKFAANNGFDGFTTTLLGSPYQDHALIKRICEEIAKNYGPKFYCADFRVGFREAHEKAKAKGIYCQNYCGCLFSEKERLEKKSSAARGKGQGNKIACLR